MTVWVLEGHYHCEGSDVLGVYSSEEAGRSGFKRYMAARQADGDGCSHDKHWLSPYEVDMDDGGTGRGVELFPGNA